MTVKTNDILSEEGIRKYLTHQELEIRVFHVISSTNTVLKQMAADGAPGGLALLAEAQTAGRGRQGRSFYSPSGTGLYMSLMLRPKVVLSQAPLLTSCAAVAVCEALESLDNMQPGIKWVNDIFLEGRKICGILTESGIDPQTGRLSYVVVGIGINLHPPEGDFPEEIRSLAGTAFGETDIPDLRNRLAALILDRLMDSAAHPDAQEIFEKYRARSLAPGKSILILTPGQEPIPAEALSLERDYALRVRLPDGTEQLLRSGEISIRL